MNGGEEPKIFLFWGFLKDNDVIYVIPSNVMEDIINIIILAVFQEIRAEMFFIVRLKINDWCLLTHYGCHIELIFNFFRCCSIVVAILD